MSNYNCDYVRRHYGVPAEIGRRVIANGEPGVIIADRGRYIGVILDSDPKKRIRNYHPAWEMQYGEMAEKLPLKRYQVLVAGWDWWDITNRTIVDVLASTPSQAQVQGLRAARVPRHRMHVRLQSSPGLPLPRGPPAPSPIQR